MPAPSIGLPDHNFLATERLTCARMRVAPGIAHPAAPMNARDTDLRDQPAYGVSEAARYVRLPAATLRTWMVGRDYPKAGSQATFHPLIRPARRQPLQLSFYNLVEAHVLRALRTEHGVALAELRKAITFAEKKLGLHRLLLSPELRTQEMILVGGTKAAGFRLISRMKPFDLTYSGRPPV